MCQRRNFVWAFFDPSWFPKDFAPPGVLLGIQALGEVSHCTKFIYSFSNLTTNTLLDYLFDVGRGLFLMVNFLSKKSLPQNP